jgi:hypothetical protein
VLDFFCPYNRFYLKAVLLIKQVMPKNIVFLILVFSLIGCSNEELKPQSILGEWRYVGTFDHRANYACYICPNFDFKKSIYRIDFMENASFSGKVNLLIVAGNYDISQTISYINSYSGVIQIKNYRLLNKPPETEQDGDFQNLFKAITNFNISINAAQGFDQLSLGNSSYDYILFARKN